MLHCLGHGWNRDTSYTTEIETHPKTDTTLKMEDPKIDPPIFMINIALSVFTSKQGGTNYSTWGSDIELCLLVKCYPDWMVKEHVMKIENFVV